MGAHTDEKLQVVDVRPAVESSREETVFTFATIRFARRILRGRKVPRELRRALANAERAAESAREQAKRLDEIVRVADAGERAPAC